MRYYIIAGERSGDLHGGNLVKALKKCDSAVTVRGFGGRYLEEAGAELTVHYDDMAFMGFVEVVKNLNKISKYIKQCKDDILQFRPDAIVLIDYGGFNTRIAKFGKQKGIKVFYYIPPKVWAWHQNRALKLKQNVDRMFVILPFEKEFFKKFDIEVDYVGNPVLDAIKAHQDDPNFLANHKLISSKSVIALLPGSRKQELQRIIPVMADVVKLNPSREFVVAAVKNLKNELYSPLRGLSNVTFVYEETYNLLKNSQAAIVTSGTATLETALFHVPQVVVYKANSLTYSIGKLVIQVPFISLVNLISGKEVVKEMIQQNARGENISNELNRILDDKSYRENMLTEYGNIIKLLDTGSASDNTARLIVNYLKN